MRRTSVKKNLMSLKAGDVVLAEYDVVAENYVFV